MAGNRFSISTEGTEVALVAATAKTVLSAKAATNVRLKLLGWGVFFDGVSATAEPVQVSLQRQTTDGTSTSVTARKTTTASETVQATAGKNFSAEPTSGDILEVKEVHPQQGFEKYYPFDQPIEVAGGGRISLKLTAPANVNCEAWMNLDE